MVGTGEGDAAAGPEGPSAGDCDGLSVSGDGEAWVHELSTTFIVAE